MGIADTDRMAVIHGIVYIKYMVAIIELEVVRVELVITSCGETDLIGPHLISRIIEDLGVGKRTETTLADLIGEGQHRTQIILGMFGVNLIGTLKTFPDREGKTSGRISPRSVEIISVS